MQSPGQQCGARTVSYPYDAGGNESTITYPGGSNAVTYSYDDANEMTSVTDWNASVTGYAYDDAGRMTTETLQISCRLGSRLGLSPLNQSVLGEKQQ